MHDSGLTGVEMLHDFRGARPWKPDSGIHRREIDGAGSARDREKEVRRVTAQHDGVLQPLKRARQGATFLQADDLRELSCTRSTHGLPSTRTPSTHGLFDFHFLSNIYI